MLKGLGATIIDRLEQLVFIYSGSTPDWEELAEVGVNRDRIRQVILARWVALGLMAVYGLFLKLLYAASPAVALSPEQQYLPLAALAFVAAYNGWYHLTYRMWARVRFTNELQLLFDLVVITALVHFSGGVQSWFWAMYMLLTLEAAFLLNRPIEVWGIGAIGGLLYGALLTAEYYDIITPVRMPFEDHQLQHTFTYEMITWGWVSIMNAAVALIGTYLMGIIRRRESELRSLGIRDGLTGLYNRRYFNHRLRGEIERCRRYGRHLSLVMIDVDNFKSFNDTYGHLEGDRLLEALAEILGKTIRRSGSEPTYDVDIACRYGGEEFVIILPETERQTVRQVAERLREQVVTNAAAAVAERIRNHVAAANMRGHNVTISLGVSTYPVHAETADDLVRAADDALYQAKAGGKNRVVLAGSPAT